MSKIVIMSLKNTAAQALAQLKNVDDAIASIHKIRDLETGSMLTVLQDHKNKLHNELIDLRQAINTLYNQPLHAHAQVNTVIDIEPITVVETKIKGKRGPTILRISDVLKALTTKSKTVAGVTKTLRKMGLRGFSEAALTKHLYTLRHNGLAKSTDAWNETSWVLTQEGVSKVQGN